MHHLDVVKSNRERIKKFLGNKSYLSPCDLNFDFRTGEIDLYGELTGKLLRKVNITYDNQLRGRIHFKERSKIVGGATQVDDLIEKSLDGFIMTELPEWYSTYLGYLDSNTAFSKAFRTCADSLTLKYFEQIIPRYILKHGRTWTSTQPRKFFVRLLEDTDAATLSQIMGEIDLHPEKRKHQRTIGYSNNLQAKVRVGVAERYDDPGLFRNDGFIMGRLVDQTTFTLTGGDVYVLAGTNFVVSDTRKRKANYDLRIHLLAPSFLAVNLLTNQALFDSNMKWKQEGKDQMLATISHETIHALEQFHEIPKILGPKERYKLKPR